MAGSREAGGGGRRFGAALALVAGLLAGGLAIAARGAAASGPPPLVLISLDGFRWDFMARAPTPALDRIARAGVRSERLIPAFPTKTFPNHYTVVTGLYTEHHGVVANNIYDPVLDARFSLGDRSAVEDPRWWLGEPLWVTARRQGLVTASFFWPGSEAPIQGQHPDHWRTYDGSVPNEERVDQVLAWLDLPPAERPSFITLYFSDVDDAAHRHGPDHPAVGEAVARVDAAVGRLLAGLDRRRLWGRSHLFVISDHGSIATPPEQVIVLDDHVDLAKARVVDWSPALALWPRPEDVEEVHAALAGAHPALEIFRKHEIPERLHYRDSRRIPPLLGLVAGGWRVASRAYLELRGGRLGLGDHGFDNQLEEMGALFLGAGPGLRAGQVVPPFESVHLYGLFCHLLGIEPAPGDGSLAAVRHLLRDGSG